MSKKPDLPRGVVDHPAKDQMRELWEAGKRGSEIAEFLESAGHPVLSAKTIGRYGQRNWNTRTTVTEGVSSADLDDELRQVLADVGDSGTVTKFSYRRAVAPRLEAGKLVDAESTTLTAEIVPFLQPFQQAQLPPINVQIPSKAPRKLSKPRKARLGIFLPDMQIGFLQSHTGASERILETTHDEAAIDVAHQVVGFLQQTYIEDGGIDLVVLAGDMMDLPEFSTHRTAPAYLSNTQLTIDRGGAECSTIRTLAPDAEIKWMQGNHEARLINSLVDKMPNLVGLSQANDENREPVISIPYLLRMEEFKVDYIDGYPDGEYWANPYLRFEHGSFARSGPGQTAAKHLSAGVSTLYGHLHRREILYQRINTHDGSRVIFSGTPGCLCRIDGSVPSSKTGIKSTGKQTSTHSESWHQGITVFWYNETDAWLEPVDIEDGYAHFRGIEFTATVDKNGNPL